MDFSKLNLTTVSDEGAWMHVTHPVTGVELPNTRILIAGKDSDRYKKSLNKYANDRAKRGGKLTAEAIESANIRIVSACVIEWEGVEEDGQALDCKEPVVVLLLAKYRWLYEQVDLFIADRGNFFAEDESEGEKKAEGKPLTGSAGVSA